MRRDTGPWRCQGALTKDSLSPMGPHAGVQEQQGGLTEVTEAGVRNRDSDMDGSCPRGWALGSYTEEGSHKSMWKFLVKHKFGVDMYTLPCIKLITNKDLLYGRGNATQHCNNLYGNRI